MINLVLFLAPLMGLTLGAQAISSEREQGTMSYLLTQPISLLELFVAKFIGLALLTMALVNPLEVFRIAAITLLRDSMELLGPSGLVARKWFGDSATVVLTSIRAIWLAAALVLAYWAMRREEQK